MRLAEDAAEFYSTEGYANFPNYRSQIRGALLEDLPKIAEHPRDVNRRRYLGDRAAVPFWGFTEGVMEYSSQFSAEAGEAAEMFVSLPDFPRIQVWMQDRLNKLAAVATEECSHFGSKACARVALSRYNIKAAAFKRLVSTIELQNAFMTLLNYWEHVAWNDFTGIGTPKEIRSGAPSIAPGLARRKRWWIRQGYKQIEARRQAQHVSDRESQSAPPPKATGTGAADGRKTVAGQTGSEVPATMEEGGRLSADRGTGDVGSDTVLKEGTEIGVTSPPVGGETPTPRQSRRHGFEPAMDLHRRIVTIVERHAPNWRSSNEWRYADTLKKICIDLDADKIEVPESWSRGEPRALDGAPAKGWSDALGMAKTGKKLVADQIRTSIEAVRKQDRN
jgi:hypothetical protein